MEFLVTHAVGMDIGKIHVVAEALAGVEPLEAWSPMTLWGGRRQPDGMSEANLQRFHPRRGASKVDTNITMITSGASCRDAATSR